MRSKLKAGLRQIRLLAKVIRGRTQPALTKVVIRVVTKHIFNNREFRTYRYPRLLRLSRWAVRNPFLALTIIAIPYFMVWLLSGFAFVDGFGLSDDGQASVRDFWAVNIGVLTVQATLVGLVFPLVIAFVGLLNRGRASFASRLTIYIESSSAIFVGVSSLLLCVAISVQLPFAAKIGDEVATAAVTVLNITWFSINAGALAYFVLNTIAFLHPERRALIVRAYTANVVWPRELTATVTSNRWANATAYGYLPAGDQVDPFASGGRARIWYSAMWDRGEVRVSRRLGRKMRLVDVRFGMLAPAIQDWLDEARKSRSEQNHDMVIPLWPGLDYEGNQALARATLPLSRVATWAVRSAVKFRRVPIEHGAIRETSQILKEMIADLITLIDTRQANEFSDQFREVIEFHAFLYRLAQSPDENINYALFASGEGLFSVALGEEWTGTYRDLIRRGVERLPVEPEFIRSIAYAPARIYMRVSNEVKPEALKSLLGLSESLAYRMIDWAVGEYRSEAGSETDDRQAFTLSRQRETYARAWRELVGGRERLLDEVSRLGRDRRSWNDLKRISGNSIEHLRATCRMTARAVWLGDQVATNWTCDLVLHWRTRTMRAWDTRSIDWRLQSESLNLEALSLDWTAIRETPLLPNADGISALAVFGAIMENAWHDHAFVLASLCIHWAIYSRAPETVRQAARMLLRGELHDDGDRGVLGGNGFSGIEILISALRITGSGEQFLEQSYAGSMDHLLESLVNIGGRDWISGRIYSSSGGPSFNALVEAHAIAIMATMTSQQAINGSLRRLLTQADDKALRRRENYLTALLDTFDSLDTATHGDLLSELVTSGDTTTFDARKDHARQLVEQSLRVLNDHRSQVIIDAEVDPERISEIAVAAGADAFAQTTFPLHFFDEIEPTKDDLEEFTLRVNGLSKGAYTKPPMAESVSNEEDWWRDALSGQVASVVWQDVLRKAKFQEIEGRTPDQFWSAVREGSGKIREAGNDPLLVISNVRDPEWLSDWRWPHHPGGVPKPADLIITTAEQGVENYEFTMNDTPVYSAQTAFGAVYLIPSQLLHRLRYHDYGDGQPVSLRFEPNTENPWFGTMHASFQRDVELGDVEGFLIRWANAPDELSSEDG